MAAETATKRAKLDGPLIGTHNGHFHADEALAVHLLRLLPTYSASPLVRTRDPSLLANCHTVVDVGGEYDPTRNLYDHHQRTFDTTFPGRNTKLSSAGLVYKHYGRDIIASQTAIPPTSDTMTVVWEKIYADFIEAFDANDNGISAYDPSALRDAHLTPRFNDRGFSIASVVNRYNYAPVVAAPPPLSSPSSPATEPPATPKQADEDARFLLASAFTGQQFEAELSSVVGSWLPARALVRTAFDERRSPSLDAQGRIMVVPYRAEGGGVPWADHLFGFEEAEGVVGEVLYVLFAEGAEADSGWRIRAVGRSRDGFELRRALPEAWRGLRGKELDDVAGVEDCVFVHASGFIGGNKSYEGALAMAKGALVGA